MCVVSNIGDNWRKTNFPDYFPTLPSSNVTMDQIRNELAKMKEEIISALRADLEKLKKELRAGKEQDEREGNPDCEMDEKVDLIKKFGEIFNIDFEEIFGKNAS